MLTHRDIWLRETQTGVIPFNEWDLCKNSDGSMALIVDVDPSKVYITHDSNVFKGPRIAIKPTELSWGPALSKLGAMKVEGFVIYALEASADSVILGGYKEVTLVPPIEVGEIPELSV